MDERRASLTALGTSLMRAVHTRLDDSPLIEDPWGDRLVSHAERQLMRETAKQGLDAEARQQLDPQALKQIEESGSPDDFLDAVLRAHPMYAWIVVRARYAEDALRAAVGKGISQYVIVGAGMDSFALRRPTWARELEVIEVDHPATQGLKRERLAACEASLGPNAHLVAADLSAEELGAALERAPFRSDLPSFFSWLGVTSYLTREANLATLRGIALCGAPGSELVFTYIAQREIEPGRRSAEFERVGEMVASMGEPWVSGFDPAQVGEDLDGAGLTLVEDLGGEQLAERYCADRDDGLRPPPSVHIARARVDA